MVPQIPSNAYYSVIQDRIHTFGMKNVFIYTVEGTPNLEQVIPQLKLHGIKHVTLMPFMMVARRPCKQRHGW